MSDVVSEPVYEDRKVPLSPAFVGKCKPEPGTPPTLTIDQLPHDSRGTLLRPAVVWFGEDLDPRIMQRCRDALSTCDLLIVCGTSSTVYPAASFAPSMKAAGVPVAEVNLDDTSDSTMADFTFTGRCGDILPDLFEV